MLLCSHCLSSILRRTQRRALQMKVFSRPFWDLRHHLTALSKHREFLNPQRFSTLTQKDKQRSQREQFVYFLGKIWDWLLVQPQMFTWLPKRERPLSTLALDDQGLLAVHGNPGILACQLLRFFPHSPLGLEVLEALQVRGSLGKEKRDKHIKQCFRCDGVKIRNKQK